MKLFLGFIFSWFKGLGRVPAITEKKADEMQFIFGKLGKDPEESRELAKALLMDVHGYVNLVPAQMQARANRMAGKIRKRNENITRYENQAAYLQNLITQNKGAIADFSAVKKAALTKKEAWS